MNLMPRKNLKKEITHKPLTVRDLREVLIPAREKVFATKKDLKTLLTKQRMDNFQKAKELKL